MKEALFDAHNELKRVDHLIFVSLKYTRTADVLNNTIQRMINFYEFIMEALLKHAIDEEKIMEIEESPIKKTDQVRALYSTDPYIIGNIESYLELRKIIRAKFTKREEYRRHLTMTVFLDGGMKKDVTMDSVKEDYEKQLEFFEYITELLIGKEHD